jgi:hypothetical protein
VTLSTSSGNISIGGGVPSDKWFSTSATRLNVDGLGCEGVETTITVRLADRFGNYNILEGTSVSFATEGGAIDASNVTDANGVTSAVWRSQDPRPADGRVSVVVMTTGEEDFFDTNANGVFDGLDSFTDINEPFIDSNEDGNRQAGELFFDWPLSVPTSVAGSYNLANSQWDGQIPIFRNFTLLMTGPPEIGPALSRIETITGGTGNITIGDGDFQEFVIYVSDANGNAPIPGTTVELSVYAGVDVDPGTLSAAKVTVLDTNQSGPYGIIVRLTSPGGFACPPMASVALNAVITWTSTCYGELKIPIYYPGTITYTCM